MGRLGRYIWAGTGVVCFWFMLTMSCWVPMSRGYILIVNWLWSWLMVGILNRVMVSRLNRVRVGRFNMLMIGRWPNGSCRFAMVGPSGCLCVQHFFGQWGRVAHTVAVSEVPIIPFSLDLHVLEFQQIKLTRGRQKPNSEQQGACGGQPPTQWTEWALKG